MMTKTPFTVFAPNGAILRSGECQSRALSQQAGSGEYVIAEASNDTREYIDLTWPEMPTRMPKQAFAEMLIVEGQVVTLAGLPAPCALVVDQTRYEVEGGEIEIEFALPGKYRLRLEAVQYLTKTVEVEI